MQREVCLTQRTRTKVFCILEGNEVGEKSKTGKSHFFRNFRYVVKKAYQWDKGLFYMCLLLGIAQAGIGVIGAVLVKFLVDAIQAGTELGQLFVIIFIASAAALLCHLMVTYVHSESWYRFVMVRLQFLLQRGEKLMRMPFSDSQDPHVLDLLEKSKMAVTDKISSDNRGVEGYLQDLLYKGLTIFTLFSYLGILLTFSAPVTVFIVVSVVLEYILNARLSKFEHTMQEKLSPEWRRVNYLQDKMADAKLGKDIRIYRIAAVLLKKYDFHGAQMLGHFKLLEKKTLSVSILGTLINLLRYGIVSVCLFYGVKQGITIGDYSMYLAAAVGFSTGLSTFMAAVADFIKKDLYIDDYIQFMELPDVAEGDKVPDLSEDCSIEFKDVSFAYPGTDKNVLENFSIRIPKGKKLALVGVNGCGKTTFIKLLTGLYTPQKGEILLNGINVQEYQKSAYYDVFSVVFQDINCFAWSIAENIALCDYEDIDFEKLEYALRLSGLKEKVDQPTEGYRTQMLRVLDENGIELSGGQTQKLALARALYKSSSFMILDEPTAALDPIAEYNAYQSFNTLIGDNSAVYVSHRLSSTRFCDEIAYLEGGRIIEMGTHEQLLKLGGKYADMFQKQAYYYQKEYGET